MDVATELYVIWSPDKITSLGGKKSTESFQFSHIHTYVLEDQKKKSPENICFNHA